MKSVPCNDNLARGEVSNNELDADFGELRRSMRDDLARSSCKPSMADRRRGETGSSAMDSSEKRTFDKRLLIACGEADFELLDPNSLG